MHIYVLNSPDCVLVHSCTLCIFLFLALHMNWIISLYRSLGVGYERLGNSRKSIENYEFAKTILVDSAGDLDELRAVCNNMGNSYESIGVSSCHDTINIYTGNYTSRGGNGVDTGPAIVVIIVRVTAVVVTMTLVALLLL